MNQYRVCYTLGGLANPNNSSSAFIGHSTNVKDIETVVSAVNPGQARQIVEGMYGGSGHCLVQGVFPIWS